MARVLPKGFVEVFEASPGYRGNRRTFHLDELREVIDDNNQNFCKIRLVSGRVITVNHSYVEMLERMKKAQICLEQLREAAHE